MDSSLQASPPPPLAPRVLALVALAGALVMNTLAQALPLGGRSTGELSALYPNAIVPVGATFSIWGVIYLAVGGWTVAQFTRSGARLGAAVAPLFALTSVWNAGWLLAWHYLYPGLSVVVMGALLTTLVLLHLRLEREGAAAWPHALARAAFGLYLGWILVATVVNLTAWLVSLGWEGWGLPDGAWGALVAGVGVGVAASVQRRFANPWVGTASAWGFAGTAAAGVAAGAQAAAFGGASDLAGLPLVTVVAGAGALLLLADGGRIAWSRAESRG